MLIKRHMSEFLPDSAVRRLVVLTGARQTGKTTMAKAKYPTLGYINLDAPENRALLRNIHSASWGRSVGDAVLDEAQKEPEVFDKIKYAFDAGDITFSIILGSSQILLLKKIRESLAGRVTLFELWPLMLSELESGAVQTEFRPPLVDHVLAASSVDLVLQDAPAVLLGPSDAELRHAEEHLMKWGGLPALLPLADEDRWTWLRDYQYTYLERDLSDLARLDDLEPFAKFERLCALRSGKLLNYSELARDAGVSVATSRRYLEYLKLSYQVMLLPPYFRNLTSSVVKAPKIYWLDVGLLRRLAGRRDEPSGEIYETMVVAELKKWIATARRDADMYFYRTRAGMELDLLVETGRRFIGFEIKGRKTVAGADLGPIRAVAASLKTEWKGGIVVYQGDEIRKLEEPSIWAVPSRRLFGAAR